MKTEEEYNAEVLQLMRDLYPTLKGEEKERAERLFPELKESESEDEKIRKTIYNCVKWYGFDSHFFKDVSQEECLAWLEKQREQKQDPCDNCKDVMLNCHNFPCIKKRAFKQGKTVLEAIIDEKVDNANKVEQKFKDGDVLNSPSHHLIWIYKDNVHYHACVNMNYVTENVATDGLISIPNDACPATKEQRDTLMKAMADAGYAFDFKKKELRKIEQKNAWSEEDEDTIEKAICVLEANFEPSEEFSELDIKRYQLVDRLKSLKERYTWKPSDEQMADLWNMMCESRPEDHQLLQDIYYGLKSLKGDWL